MWRDSLWLSGVRLAVADSWEYSFRFFDQQLRSASSGFSDTHRSAGNSLPDDACCICINLLKHAVSRRKMNDFEGVCIML
jgi:hypothetical protein